MNEDEFQLGTESGIRESVHSGEPMLPQLRAHFMYSLLRFMLDYENRSWVFRLHGTRKVNLRGLHLVSF